VIRPPRLSKDRNYPQIGRISCGCLDCLGFPGRHFVSSSSSSINTGEKLSSGPFIRRRSKLLDIPRDWATRFWRRGIWVTCSRDALPLRSYIFKLRPISDFQAHSLISFYQNPPPSQRLVSTDASPSRKVANNAPTGSGELIKEILSMLNPPPRQRSRQSRVYRPSRLCCKPGSGV
jgi:hypothetical protein